MPRIMWECEETSVVCQRGGGESQGTERDIMKCQCRTTVNINQCLVTASSHCLVRLFTSLSGKKKRQEKVRVNIKHFVLFPPPPPLFSLLFSPSLLPFFRYSGATCGLAFVFVYPSLIYVISMHRAGQLTWPALIIHIFIILLGLANLIAQFLF